MKKIMAAILIFVMMCSFGVFAAPIEQQNALDLVSQLGIMQGDTDGNMRLNDPVTRAEFTKVAMCASVYQNSIATNLPISPFKDVPYTHWAAPYIKVALSNKLVSGYTDATFQPENTVLLEEAFTIALKLLGYTDADFGGSWPYGQMNLANSIGLNDNISATVGQNLTRSDVAILIYNMLNCKTKQGTAKYIDSLGYKYYESIAVSATNATDPSLEANDIKTAQGTFQSASFDSNLLAIPGEMLINSKQDILSFHPLYQVITVGDLNWKYELGITDASNISVTRDGKNATIDEIKTNDIVYYYKNSNTLQAYTKKITGIYESATPNKDAVTSVKVSGVSYIIETYAAIKALASGGKFNYGDTITLLLGKDNKIAGVISPNAANTSNYGYLYGAGKKEFIDADGNSYSSYYVQVALTSGDTYEYACDKDYTSFKNSIVQVKFDQGNAVLSVNRTQSDLYGTVNIASSKIGTFAISNDLEVLDVSTTDSVVTGNYISVFPQRLDGITLTSDDVLLYEKNEKNEIFKLILKNVTGDAYQYGLILKATNSSSNMSASGNYSYDLGGATQTFKSSGTTFPVSTGQPVKLIFAGSQIERMEPLTRLESAVTNLTNTYIESGTSKYLLSDKVIVYNRTNLDSFMLIPLSQIVDSKDYTLTAYFDRSLKNGGRVRVIIAQEIK